MTVESEIAVFGVEGAALLAALHASSFDRPWSETEMRDLLASPGVSAVTVGAAGDPAGMALVRAVADEAELLTICIRPGKRSGGLGRSLLAAAETLAREAGAARLFLEVSAANAAALGLYAAAGYETTGRRPAYYADGSDAVLMDKPL
ncbi:ribosomal-protein-alanine acetyltransferase [Marinicauda salina]|uniref:Ribosomal-protein-alanine acetyltransferase n=1 Tax=Marinicauda salina TaxID=2135793 RepID=A0A2U2BWG8_9PROT|nr:GNAT family N-acetyltransferase [Marinicauda salina]PWE18330.1 ribosomal-protein-alanine acetyltransferase [Marinicauda salina]